MESRNLKDPINRLMLHNLRMGREYTEALLSGWKGWRRFFAIVSRNPRYLGAKRAADAFKKMVPVQAKGLE